MFFNKKYINDANISSISFWLYNREDKYNLVKLYNKDKAKAEYWQILEGEEFVLLNENGEAELTLKDNSDNTWDEYDESERNLIETLKQIPIYASFINKRGSIEVTIKMNNGDTFTDTTKLWRTDHTVINFRAEITTHIEKEYNDQEIDIETIYTYLQKGNTNKKVMI